MNPSTRCRSSQHYDIIKNVPRDERSKRILSECDDLAYTIGVRRSLRNAVEDKIHSTTPEEAENFEKKRLNRITYDRFKIEINRGFNIISNTAYSTVGGIPGSPPQPPLSRPIPSPWDMIHSSTHSIPP